MLGKLQGATTGKTTRSDGGPWSDCWSNRKLHPLRIPSNEGAEVIFLDDIKIFVAAELVVGWVNTNNGKSFAKKDFARVSNYDDSGEETNTRCPLTEVLGRTRMLGVAPVLTDQPDSGKNGSGKPYSIRLLVVKSQPILETLQLASQSCGQDLKYAAFKVRRTGEQMAPAIGDLWQYVNHIEEEELTKSASDWRTSLDGVNLDRGFPVMPDEDAVAILRNHVKVVGEHPDVQGAVMNYDRDAWEFWSSGKTEEATSEEGASADLAAMDDEFDLDLGL